MKLNRVQKLTFYRFAQIIKFVGPFLLVFLLIGCQPASTSIPTEKIATTMAQNPAVTPSQPGGLPSSTTAIPQATDLSGTSASVPTMFSPTATVAIESSPAVTQATAGANIKTVFLIVMENHNWSDILNSPSAPFINQTLLPQASYASQYYNPAGNHPSEPNYLWLEAGTNFGIKNDDNPQKNHQSSTDHLVTYLQEAGITWKAYQEGITGTTCPLKGDGLYAPKHNPMVYFDDVTNQNDPNSSYCIAHERPFSELQADLQNNMVAQYNFITPDLCHDMHNSVGCDTLDEIKNGDTWLSEQVPMILASGAYKNGGVLIITWDESEDGDNPIGMIVLSPFAKGGGYTNSIHYTHSSTLRTVQEIFNVTPFLGDAALATDLSDLFSVFP
jgi:phosphatidylinositol-3-phosphatase